MAAEGNAMRAYMVYIANDNKHSISGPRVCYTQVSCIFDVPLPSRLGSTLLTLGLSYLPLSIRNENKRKEKEGNSPVSHCTVFGLCCFCFHVLCCLHHARRNNPAASCSPPCKPPPFAVHGPAFLVPKVPPRLSKAGRYRTQRPINPVQQGTSAS